MKIITSEAVYVQKNDIGFLNHTDLAIPASIFLKVFGNGITIIDNSNRFEFVKFEEECEIEFFKNLDWIVDYDSVKDLDESQIIELAQVVAQQKNNIASKYLSMTDDEQRANRDMVFECEILDFKMYSLREILWFKQGHLKFDLPGGIEFSEISKKAPEKGLEKILRKFQKKNK